MQAHDQQQSPLPIVLMIGLLALIAVVVGGFFLASPFFGTQSHYSSGTQSHYGSFVYRVSYTCREPNQDCAITITNGHESGGSMTVSATSSTPAGTTFYPATITIAPGSQAQIAVKSLNGVCLTAINLRITNPQNITADLPVAMQPCDATPAAQSPAPTP